MTEEENIIVLMKSRDNDVIFNHRIPLYSK
jgi:hypothetical protein